MIRHTVHIDRLLLDNSTDSNTHTLCNHNNHRVPFAKTNRFKNSFLLHALDNF